MRSNKLKPLVIGDITIEHPLALAPMAGVTDLPYRLLCKEQGAGMMCTEMVSAKGLYYGNRKSEPLMATDPKEIPVAIQIFGSDPEIMGQMAAKVNDGPVSYTHLIMVWYGNRSRRYPDPRKL